MVMALKTPRFDRHTTQAEVTRMVTLSAVGLHIQLELDWLCPAATGHMSSTSKHSLAGQLQVNDARQSNAAVARHRRESTCVGCGMYLHVLS